MIIGIVIFSLALVWLGGFLAHAGWPITAYIVTALGAGWLGIIYSFLITHQCSECTETDLDPDPVTTDLPVASTDADPLMYTRFRV